jgi:hypothetical protein
MEVVPSLTAAAAPAESESRRRARLAAVFNIISLAVSTASLTLQYTNTLHTHLLPHYNNKEILEQLHILSLPYVHASSSLPQVAALLNELPHASPQPRAYLLLSENEQRFERLIRFSLTEFLLLYSDLEACILQPYSIPEMNPAASRKRRLHPIDQFLLWLFHSDGNDPDLLGVLFSDASRSTVDRVADHITAAVNDA